MLALRVRHGILRASRVEARGADRGRERGAGHGFVGTVLPDAYAILAGPNGDQILHNGLAHYGRLERLDHGWQETGERGWRNLTDDQRDEHAPEYLDDIDAILTDAGYLPVTNADMGTWAVYPPIPPVPGTGSQNTRSHLKV